MSTELLQPVLTFQPDVDLTLSERLEKSDLPTSDYVAALLDPSGPNPRLVDLSCAPGETTEFSPVLASSKAGQDVLRHSTTHVLAQAALRLFPGAHFYLGPITESGFFYDFALPHNASFSDTDLERIEEEMRSIIATNQPFVRHEVALAAARETFSTQPLKLQVLSRITDATDTTTVSLYRNADSFVDLCRGPHVPSTSYLGHFRLTGTSAVHASPEETTPSLRRIYGVAFDSAEALADYFVALEEAEKRDHRRLATELDLLSFPATLGGGLAVWHPKGALVRKLMEDYSRSRHQESGYSFVVTPHLASTELFETSGHLGFYRDGMYPPMEMDNGTFYPKPMNCPLHCLVFDSRPRSYRELPLRLFELGTVYRYERAGTLHGLMRIRGFTQDDSHIYCAPDQLATEITSLLGFVMSVLRAFGFSEFTANLSTKDPTKYVGSDEIWDRATLALTQAMESYGLAYQIKEGDAAFYGPKIDIDVRDALGRSWQLSTIQCDFNLPERFDLSYTGADGKDHQPVMIHRALFGSVERFFGVLLEHYAGAFPTWLAPIQVSVLPVAAAHQAYAERVVRALESAGHRVELTQANDPLGKRIRAAKTQKIPYVLVVGDSDVANSTLGVNPRGGELRRDVPVAEFFEALSAEVRRQQELR